VLIFRLTLPRNNRPGTDSGKWISTKTAGADSLATLRDLPGWRDLPDGQNQFDFLRLRCARSGARLEKSPSRKPRFAEAFQRDLGCPVPRSKNILLFLQRQTMASCAPSRPT
jgi:hypothetical protein